MRSPPTIDGRTGESRRSGHAPGDQYGLSRNLLIGPMFEFGVLPTRELPHIG
jgi:hypothetical protein